MNELIKREDAIRALLELSIIDCINKHDAVGKCVATIIGLPSADRPSKEGEWEIEEFTSIYGKGYGLTCSECGDVFTATDEALLREHYCRHCGAKTPSGGKEQTMRLIDADKYKMELHAVRSVFSRTDSWENAVRTGLTRAINGLDSAPTIKTKEVKYFDEDEKVWKIGRVIVDE